MSINQHLHERQSNNIVNIQQCDKMQVDHFYVKNDNYDLLISHMNSMVCGDKESLSHLDIADRIKILNELNSRFSRLISQNFKHKQRLLNQSQKKYNNLVNLGQEIKEMKEMLISDKEFKDNCSSSMKTDEINEKSLSETIGKSSSSVKTDEMHVERLSVTRKKRTRIAKLNKRYAANKLHRNNCFNNHRIRKKQFTFFDNVSIFWSCIIRMNTGFLLCRAINSILIACSIMELNEFAVVTGILFGLCGALAINEYPAFYISGFLISINMFLSFAIDIPLRHKDKYLVDLFYDRGLEQLLYEMWLIYKT
jgi:uncharacterized protein YukE